MKGILINNDGDLMVRNGSFVIGNCDSDVAERIIQSWQGEFKEAPLLGGNIDKMRHGIVDPFWRGNIKSQLQSEHINVKRLDIMDNGIELEIED